MKPKVIKPSTLFTIFLAASCFAACGDDDAEVTTETLAPGEDCLGDGTRVTVDGEVSIICNGDPNRLEETVSAGSPGNPCVWNATKVTSRSATGALSTEWYCDTPAVEELPPLAQIAHRYMTTLAVSALHSNFSAEFCGNAFPEDGAEPPGATFVSPTKEQIEAQTAKLGACILPYLAVAPEGHERFVEVYSCMLDKVPNIEECLFPLPDVAPGSNAAECRNELGDQRDFCFGDADGASGACGMDESDAEIQLSGSMFMYMLSTAYGQCESILLDF